MATTKVEFEDIDQAKAAIADVRSNASDTDWYLGYFYINSC